MMRATPTIVLVLAAVGATLVEATPCAAQTEEELADARNLGREGLALFDKGEYEAALAKLDAAEQRARVPTLGLYAARALWRLGRLLEARTRFVAVKDTPLPPNSPEVWREAKASAEDELKKLNLEIPSLAVDLMGLSADERSASRITVDGKPWPGGSAAIDVDPGPHTVSVAVGKRTRTAKVEAQRHAKLVAHLDFAEPTADEPGPSPLVVAGAVTLGVGGAGLIAWGVTGALATAKASDYGCDGEGRCAVRDVSDLQTLRTSSMVTFYVGGGLALAGAGLLVGGLLADADPSAESARIVPLIGPGAVGVAGAFD